MSSPESYCPQCFTDVAANATRCPNPECGIGFIRCRNESCSALLAADAKFCADCGLHVEAAPTPEFEPEPTEQTQAPPVAPPKPPVPAPTEPPAAAEAPAPALDLSALLSMFQTGAGSSAAPAAPQPPATNAPVSAPAPAPVAVSLAVGAPLVNLQAEYQTPQVIKKGQQAFLRVRALAGGARDALDVRVEYQCGLFATEGATVAIPPGAITTFPPARFVPTVPGSDSAHLTFTAKTSAGVPVGRWTGDVFLTVEDDAKQALQITNTGGGDVVMYGAPPTAPANPLAGLPPIWKPLALSPDTIFQRRTAGFRKPSAIAAPIGPAAPPGQALVVVEDRTTLTRTAVAVVRGPFASIGRGGKPDTSWWVQGEPLNRSAHLNISGLHAALNLRDGHAWATDCSKFGTKLNGALLIPKEATALADGDELALADGFRVRVGVGADTEGAGALWLARTDAHANRLAYALVARSVPAPVFVPGVPAPIGWLAWTAGVGGFAVLQFRPADGSWTAVPPDEPTAVGPRYRVGWRPVSAPRGQDLDLNPNPPILF